jgi:outer membrane protein assembly factor BamB
MNNKNRFGLPFIVLAAVFAINATYLTAQDWPRWRGSNNDGIVRAQGLNLDWTQRTPTLAWTFSQTGAGFSSPTVVGNTLYITGTDATNDFAVAIDTRNGNVIWRQALAPRYAQHWGDGPRGSITVDGDRLYLILGAGQVMCLSAADGRIIWQKHMINDFGGAMKGDWGYSESPLIDGNNVIVSPGGSRGMIVALNKTNGDLVWRSTQWTDLASYSSPIVAVVDGVRQYIQQSSSAVGGVSASDGSLLWRVEIPAYANASAIIPSPIIHENMVYVTNGYRSGCNLVRLTRDGNRFRADLVYHNSVMINQHGGVVLVDGHIYGFSEGAGWVCQNLRSGEQVWVQAAQRDGAAKGAIIAINNNRLLLLNENSGLMTVIEASPNGYRELGRMQLPRRSTIQNNSNNNSVWAHPVIANGKLYVRDHDLLFAFNLQ